MIFYKSREEKHPVFIETMEDLQLSIEYTKKLPAPFITSKYEEQIYAELEIAVTQELMIEISKNEYFYQKLEDKTTLVIEKRDNFRMYQDSSKMRVKFQDCLEIEKEKEKIKMDHRFKKITNEQKENLENELIRKYSLKNLEEENIYILSIFKRWV